MKLVMLLVTLTLLQGCAHSDPWTRQDTTLQLITTGMFAIDAVQTSEIQYHGNIRENGPFAKHVLGRQPHTAETWQYFATVSLSHWLISRALPAKWRPFWQGTAIGYQAKTIYLNCSSAHLPRKLCHER